MIKRYSLFILLSLSLLVTLTGCGFHLRGKVKLSSEFQYLYLNTNSNFTPMTQAIEQVMLDANIHLLDSPEDAKMILYVYNETQTEQLMTIGANQETRQYQLNYSFTYALKTKQGKTILGPETITESRSQIIQANQLLTNNSETNDLYNSMRQDAVIDLMYRLSSSKANTRIEAIFSHTQKSSKSS